MVGAGAACGAFRADDTGPSTITAEGGVTDAGASPSDAPPAELEPTWHDFTDAKWWSSFDIRTLGGSVSPMSGAVFDGQNIVFAPTPFPNSSSSSWVFRYDTRREYTAKDSWALFDVRSLSATEGYIAGVTDGTYVVLPPRNSSSLMRYDTRRAFNSPQAWTKLDLGGAQSFGSAVLEGETSFFGPGGTVDGGTPFVALDVRAGTATAFDPAVGLEDRLRSLSFKGAASDGKSLYFGPDQSGVVGVVARHDLASAPSSGWSFFEVSSFVDDRLRGYGGVVAAGPFVYFVPYGADTRCHGLFLRYDTRRPFTDRSSYEFFDLHGVNAAAEGFIGGVFDGRYVYLVPSRRGSLASHLTSGLVVRYDTRAAFADKSAYETHDVSTIGVEFHGAVFDGRYVHLVPTNGVTVRFDARDPKKDPPPRPASFL